MAEVTQDQVTIVEYIHTLFGNNEQRDDVILLLCNIMLSKVRRYCHFQSSEPLPGDLLPVIAEMCDTRMRTVGYGSPEPKQQIASVSDNGQSVSYKTNEINSEKLCGGLTDSEKTMLAGWRRLF